MKQPLFFRIYKDGQLKEIKQLQAEQIVIGSIEEGTEICLKEEGVSPIHAMVEERDSGFFLCDLGSTEGTRKNGEEILDTSLASGDEIQIGPLTLQFFVGVPKPKSRPPRVAAEPPPSPAPQGEEAYDRPAAVVRSPLPSEKPPAPAPAPVQPKPVAVEKTNVSKERPTEVLIEMPQSKIDIDLETPRPVASQKRPSERSAQPVSASKPAGVVKKFEAPTPKSASKTATSGGLETLPSKVVQPKAGPGRTYAPASHYKDLKQIIKPSKGTIVEIVVAWKERIISTHHFSERKTVLVGSHPKNDIVIPVFGSTSVSHPLLKLEGAAKVFVTSDMKGDLVIGETVVPFADLSRKGRAEASGAGSVITLQQGELVRVDFGSGVAVYIRYVSPSPKPLAAPFLDLSTAEISGLVGVLISGAFLWLYMAVYQPLPPVEDLKVEEPPKRAVFLYKAQIEPINPVESDVEPSPNAKLSEKKSAAQEKSPTPSPNPQKAASKDDEGAASNAAPNKSKSTEKKLTTPNPGKGTGIQKAAVAAKNKQNDAQGGATKDVTRTGILSVLSGKGAQDKLSQVYSGAGVVGGLSKTATGSGGQSAAGAGDTPGEGLKDIGAGGTGTATVGIAGVNTKGRGSGREGYGTGSIGDKKNATVIPGGAEEAFSGTIDREAIRRVILERMREIKACYDRALNKDPSLHGKIVLGWVIGDRGSVRSASVASTTMNSSEVEQCMVARLKTWRFPEPPAGQEAEVTYPFVFTAQN